MTINIFEANETHLDEMFDLAERFWYESNYSVEGMTLRPDFWKQTVRNHIGLDDTAAICAELDGKIVGYCLIYYQTDYTVERIGEMFQFYVQPEYRKTHVARKIVEAVVKKYDEWGCKRCYCEASPGLSHRDHLSLFKNLWSKFGYKEVGITLMREI